MVSLKKKKKKNIWTKTKTNKNKNKNKKKRINIFVMSQIDFPPVLFAALIWQRFLNIQSGKRVLTEVANNIKCQRNLCILKISINQFNFYQNGGRAVGGYLIRLKRVYIHSLGLTVPQDTYLVRHILLELVLGKDVKVHGCLCKYCSWF